MSISAIIFDLDGVIVSTDELHFQAWKQLADAEGIPFTRQDNERLRGVSRMESLDIILEKASRPYDDAEKLALAERKNERYRELLHTTLGPGDILPGVLAFLDDCQKQGIKIAIGSSSRNSPTILDRIGLAEIFDATADGNDITRSKPDPEVFLLAAERLGVAASDCLVVEDAEAGVSAAIAGGMQVLAVGSAADDPRAHHRAAGLDGIALSDLLA